MQKLDSRKMRAMREGAGLTQGQAAKLARMTASRWNDIESGRRINITIETLGRIAKALDCKAEDLLTKRK